MIFFRKRIAFIAISGIACALAGGCAPSHAPDMRAGNSSAHLTGGRSVLASWYGGGEALNRHTSNGEVFRPNGFTAAHRTLPLGTKIVVAHGDKQVTVRVNDRGPAKWTGRSLDLSRGAARALGIIHSGVARVRIWIKKGEEYVER